MSNSMDYAIQIKNLGLRFELSHNRVYTIQDWVLKQAQRFIKHDGEYKSYHRVFEDLNFTLPKHEILGVIGRNGSGKTTLLRLISGILTPDEGEIRTNGTVSAILGIGAGFNLELTGMANIYLNALVLGLSKKEIDSQVQSIIDFAELQEYIGQPVKYYSTGMISRLGFAIATCVNTDILLLDEVLSVGDIGFREKAKQRITEITRKTHTQIIVSHSMKFILEQCTKALYIDQGKIVHYGPPAETIEIFEEAEAAAREKKHAK